MVTLFGISASTTVDDDNYFTYMFIFVVCVPITMAYILIIGLTHMSKYSDEVMYKTAHVKKAETVLD